MDYITMWKLMNLGVDIDFEKRTFTIKLGPLTVKDISFRTVKALSSDPITIEALLTKQFIQRDVMYADYRAETVAKCIESLRTLQTLCEERSKSFGASKKPEDHFFSTALAAWANECDEAADTLESALASENDPADTGMDTSAKKCIPAALGKMRKATYPSVELFTQLLPDGNPVKVQAVEKLSEGKDVLIRGYNIPGSQIPSPDIESQKELVTH